MGFPLAISSPISFIRVKNQQDNAAADPTDRTVDNSDLNQRAEKIADAVVEQVAQVKDARTVISEKMAYVSVAIDETADTAESATLKDEMTKNVNILNRIPVCNGL